MTAKGIRIHVTAYGSNSDEVATKACETLEKAIGNLKAAGCTIAPMETTC
jgi:hypothetical protein